MPPPSGRSANSRRATAIGPSLEPSATTSSGASNAASFVASTVASTPSLASRPESMGASAATSFGAAQYPIELVFPFTAPMQHQTITAGYERFDPQFALRGRPRILTFRKVARFSTCSSHFGTRGVLPGGTNRPRRVAVPTSVHAVGRRIRGAKGAKRRRTTARNSAEITGDRSASRARSTR